MGTTSNLHSNIMHAQVVGMPDPTVGMGVTIMHYTDRSVGTVVEVVAPDHVIFTDDTVTYDTSKGEATMGHQNWLCTPNPTGGRSHAMRHANGRWYTARPGVSGKYHPMLKGTPIALGRKDYFYDWSF